MVSLKTASIFSQNHHLVYRLHVLRSLQSLRIGFSTKPTKLPLHQDQQSLQCWISQLASSSLQCWSWAISLVHHGGAPVVTYVAKTAEEPLAEHNSSSKAQMAWPLTQPVKLVHGAPSSNHLDFSSISSFKFSEKGHQDFPRSMLWALVPFHKYLGTPSLFGMSLRCQKQTWHQHPIGKSSSEPFWEVQ